MAASLPPGYLAIQPLGLGKGVSNDAEPAHEGKGIHVSVCLLQLLVTNSFCIFLSFLLVEK